METFLKLSGVVAFHFSRMWKCSECPYTEEGCVQLSIKALYSLPDKYIHPGKKIVIVKALDDVLGARRESS